MRSLLILDKMLFVVFICAAQAMNNRNKDWFLLDKQDNIPEFSEYTNGDTVPVTCIQRRIDGGIHKIDARKNIIFKGFPKCKETNDFLRFSYKTNQDFTCTIHLADELFHLFQLYIHEDAPFSCRLPIIKEKKTADKHGLSVPLTFNFRGRSSENYIDIDNNMNVIVQAPSGYNSIVSAVGWSSGTNLTRVIVGDYLPLHFSVRWLHNAEPKYSNNIETPFTDGFYALPNSVSYNFGKQLTLVGLVIGILSSIITYYISYNFLLKKTKKFGFPVPNKFEDGGENGLVKKD
ncbi:hypothetical protein DASC09_024930 [Saccharomycopsis crataegensis]|uniref:Uncharacterized protein n=1 Tax=Saccharomycopsis crataegensis TaxID=43959 RepID=A0AAV5QK61_9ASCO|nr:hypothetical protein DASC09_024930 [Saccharomycopsis crataegensis]